MIKEAFSKDMDYKDYEYYLDVNGQSKHLNTKEKFNENNSGFGITASKYEDSVVEILTAGGYKNSYNNNSFYAGGGVAKRMSLDDLYMDVGVIGGAVTGYDKPISPLAALYMSVGNKGKSRINVLVAPKTKKNPAMIMMNMGIPFK